MFGLALHKEASFSEVCVAEECKRGNLNIMWERSLNEEERKSEDEIKEKARRIVWS